MIYLTGGRNMYSDHSMHFTMATKDFYANKYSYILLICQGDSTLLIMIRLITDNGCTMKEYSHSLLIFGGIWYA